MPHLTCVGHSKEEICEILTTLQAAGINHLMALRGDAPKNDPSYQPHPGGFAHASDLIEYAAANFEFHIGCAFYPEKHPDAEHLDDDIKWLKHKQDCGAEFATSQLFFDNAFYYEFRDHAAKANITMPLIAGILPVTSLSQLTRIGELSGQAIPAEAAGRPRRRPGQRCAGARHRLCDRAVPRPAAKRRSRRSFVYVQPGRVRCQDHQNAPRRRLVSGDAEGKIR